VIAGLPHDEAVTEFERHVADEKPVWDLKQQQKAQAKADREAEKARKKAEKEATADTPEEEYEPIPA
jgi:hypothetical protein